MGSRLVGSGIYMLIALLSGVVAAVHGNCVPLILCGLALLAVDYCSWALLRASGLAQVLMRHCLRPKPTSRQEPRITPHSPQDGADHKRKTAVSFVVCKATARDVQALRKLYERDYVTCHRNCHPGAAGAASEADWRSALGDADFEAVIDEVASNNGAGSVRLLKCVEVEGSGPQSHGKLVGYVLYELREKGSPRRRQRYCELVNIVVSEDHRGCGAGRRLFEALRSDLAGTASAAQAGDLRLYVAERNLGPLAWYRRMGFQDAGWQTERLNGAEVRFLRMTRRSSAEVK